ncbi:hypothetical protein [Sphingomonas sp. NPDC079357]|uniref:hypothetical protein n=1 Tax=Sphingomonas sp. NPDC079357 TaxID=3364518 RepID=UPI00384DBD91
MIAALLSLAAATTAPTIEEVRQLPPAQAGALALADYQHGLIAEVHQLPRGLLAPGVAELEMIERGVPFALGGCLRQRWIVAFRRDPAVPTDPQRLYSVQPQPQIALRNGGCATADYVGVNHGIEPATALIELARVQAWRHGRRAPHYRCIDRTTSGMCADPIGPAREVARLRPWMISRDGDGFSIWFGQPGSMVTILRYRPDDPASASVERRFPAPF